MARSCAAVWSQKNLATSGAQKAMRRANYRRALTACLEGRGYTVR